MTTLTCVTPVHDPRCASFACASRSSGSLDGPGLQTVQRLNLRRHLPGAVQFHRSILNFSTRGPRRGRWQCMADLDKSESRVSESLSPPSSENCCSGQNGAAEPGPSTVDVKNESATSGGTGEVFETFGPGKQGNRLVALASVTAAVGLFLSGRFADAGPGLPQLAAVAISYEEALSNGKPTVVEFYADWCEVCKETARDVYRVEEEYRDQINFVMLNVDNSRWEQELDEFGVEGIPHFAFLDNKGNEEGNIVGRLPKKILKENLAALARGDTTVPHSRIVGQFSSADSRGSPPVVGPRSHSQMS